MDPNLESKRNVTSPSPNILTPRKSLSAFFWFTNDRRQNVMAQNPKFTLTDLCRELGRMWDNADAETKSHYETVAEEDRIRYETEMAEFNIKYPNYQWKVPKKIPSDDEESD